VKKLIAGLVFATGCLTACHKSAPRSAPAPAPVLPAGQVGGADPTTAVRGFLAAAKQQDLQAMSAYFGDQEGVARDRIPRDALEKREIIMAMCLRHDSYDIIGDAPGMNGARMLAVNLVRGSQSKAVTFEVVPTAERRWFVRSFDLEKLADFCGRG
jgi:hypothetical protein